MQRDHDSTTAIIFILKNKKTKWLWSACLVIKRGRINCRAYLESGKSGGLLLGTSITNMILCKLFNFSVSSDKS